MVYFDQDVLNYLYSNFGIVKSMECRRCKMRDKCRSRSECMYITSGYMYIIEREGKRDPSGKFGKANNRMIKLKLLGFTPEFHWPWVIMKNSNSGQCTFLIPEKGIVEARVYDDIKVQNQFVLCVSQGVLSIFHVSNPSVDLVGGNSLITNCRVLGTCIRKDILYCHIVINNQVWYLLLHRNGHKMLLKIPEGHTLYIDVHNDNYICRSMHTYTPGSLARGEMDTSNRNYLRFDSDMNIEKQGSNIFVMPLD